MKAALLAAAFFATWLSLPAWGQSHSAATATAASAARFEAAPCPALPGVRALSRARCGYLIVPENRARRAGRALRLLVAIVPSQSALPAPDPVVYLSGGPGGVAIGEADSVVGAGLNRDRDLVLMNQRGSDLTNPALTCPSIDAFARTLLRLRFYSGPTRRAHLAATRSCHRRLVALGADLAAYNTAESAADFADLRKALGYAQWNVFGVSYGTDLAQALMRNHPAGIRSVVLDSTVPVNVALADYWLATRDGFAALFQACSAQEACRLAHPHLEATFERLVNGLEARPLTAVVRNEAGENLKVMIDGGALVDWLRNQSYDASGLRRAPDLIGALAAGRDDAVKHIAADRVRAAPAAMPGVPAVSYGLAFGVVCREQDRATTPGDLIATGRRAFPTFPASVRTQAVGGWAYADEDCRRIWKVPAAPAKERRPVASPIPTLLISGGLDAITSVAWTKVVAAGLSTATIVTIPGAGHFAAPQSPCAQAVIASFLARPNAADISCVGSLKTPQFTS
jgi:pimeloyl-ACP methyl ester carboxylesterase